jgi:hypothetical protein
MTSTVSFDIDTTNTDTKLGVEVWLNDQQLIDLAHVTESIAFNTAIDDDNGEHELRIILKNKSTNYKHIGQGGYLICHVPGNFDY